MDFQLRGMYIGGRWVREGEHGLAPVLSPYDQIELAVVPLGGQSDVDNAVAAALEALHSRAWPAAERIELLERATSLLSDRQERFAVAIAAECAKPIKTARVEVCRAIDTLRFTLAEARTMPTTSIPIDAVASGAGKLAFTMRVPVGVVAAIAPFNFPLNLVMHKVAPALAVGCPVVLKPASQTPISALLLADLMDEVGLPKGWLSVVTGSGRAVGEPLTRHPDIAYITFTGSPEVGWGIAEAAPKKRVKLELGSNAPLVVDRDADWPAAARQAALGGFVQAGQSCVSTQRIFVHHDIADAFVERLTEHVDALIVGDPMDDSVDMSAVISESEAERVERWICEAERAGAKVVTGGQRSGAVVQPTILRDVTNTMKVQCGEVFGPVVTVTEFTSFDAALEMANDSVFGLNAGVFTNDVGHALQAVRDLDYGSVYINDVPTVRADHQPYGGSKESGNTREGPHYAMQEMTELKFVTLR